MAAVIVVYATASEERSASPSFGGLGRRAGSLWGPVEGLEQFVRAFRVHWSGPAVLPEN